MKIALYYHRHTCAFSITELLVSIVILSLLLSSSILHISPFTSSKKLKRSAQELSQLLDNQALEATTTNQDITIVFELPTTILRHTEFNSAIKKILLRLPDSLTITRAQFANISSAPHSLILRSDGSATPGTIIVSDNHQNTCSITQALRGPRTLTCTEAKN